MPPHRSPISGRLKLILGLRAPTEWGQKNNSGVTESPNVREWLNPQKKHWTAGDVLNLCKLTAFILYIKPAACTLAVALIRVCSHVLKCASPALT